MKFLRSKNSIRGHAMLHSISSSHKMLRPQLLKPLNFSQIFSNNTGVSFGISRGNSLGCSLRIPQIMASPITTAVTNQQQPVSTQDDLYQHTVTRPLQVCPVSFLVWNLVGFDSFFWLKIIYVECGLSQIVEVLGMIWILKFWALENPRKWWEMCCFMNRLHCNSLVFFQVNLPDLYLHFSR